jgi:hydrogenase-4 component B
VTGALLVGAAALLAAGGAVPALSRRVRAGLLVQAAACALAGTAGALLTWRGGSVGAQFTDELALRLGADRLSGFFLLTLGLVAAPALVFASGSIAGDRRGRAVAALTAPFVGALALVVCARDVVSFLAAFELMTILPAAIILIWRPDEAARRTVFVYIAVTHVAGAGVWVALLVLAAHGGLAGPPLAAGSGTGALVAVAALVGFGAKAGAAPLHVWLPRAHPIAPTHVSALMSGVMIKIALYGLIRVLLEWLTAPPLWLGLAVLSVGAVSAVGGVLYALFQHELKRLLALHSIENVGIILLGIGASLLLRHLGEPAWAGVALAAALLHTLNHALFKALLFLGAGAIDRAVHGLEIDRLGGLGRRMPWTGTAFAVGALAIAGLPPLNGFASEWLTLQALYHVVGAGGPGAGLAGAIALAALAVTAALAVYCFAKVIGLVLLGPPRRSACAVAVDPPRSLRLPLVALAACCVALGAVPGLLAGRLAAILPGGALAGGASALRPAGTGGLPTLAIALTMLAGIVVALALRGRRVAAPAPTWACGQPVERALDWTGAGFTKPVRLVLEALLRPEREISVTVAGGVVREVSYRGRVPLLVEERLYAPLVRGGLAAAAVVRRLQSGQLGAYAAYLAALLLALLATIRLGGFE